MSNELSALPWDVQDAYHDGAYGQTAHYEIIDANGRVIADTFNSEVAEIELEHGTDGVHRWDEQGRKDTAAIVLAVNCHPELFAACIAAIEACGSSANWQGKTKRFLELIEAVIPRINPLALDVALKKSAEYPE